MGNVYLGIEINDKYTMLSYYHTEMKEPETISTVMGSEAYQIPTYLSKRNGMGQWYFGNQGKQQAIARQATGVDSLYSKALKKEVVYLEQVGYESQDLLVIYLKKILSLLGRNSEPQQVEKITICVDKVNLEVMEMFSLAMTKIGYESHQIMLIDHREAFYYYALNQEPQVFLHDVMLFDYTGAELSHCLLQRNHNTVPQMITLEQFNHGSLMDNKDVEFEQIITKTFAGKVISGVYLIGDGFDGDWMKVSLQKLCQHRKVFLGKNLYSKGACFAGVVKQEKREWPFVYIGDNELKLNLCLKVIDENELQFYTLISAGESWFETKGECEVILDGSPEIEFWIQRPESRKAHIQVLELKDLPSRAARTTRLRIEALPLSDREIKVIIKDLGFGEIVPATNKTWEHILGLE